MKVQAINKIITQGVENAECKDCGRKLKQIWKGEEFQGYKKCKCNEKE